MKTDNLKKVSAIIKSVDSVGNMTVEFSEEMKLDLSKVNSTYISIWVNPSDRSGINN